MTEAVEALNVLPPSARTVAIVRSDVNVAICSVIAIFWTSAEMMAKSDSVAVWNPAFSAVSVYRPGGTSPIWNAPVASDRGAGLPPHEG